MGLTCKVSLRRRLPSPLWSHKESSDFSPCLVEYFRRVPSLERTPRCAAYNWFLISRARSYLTTSMSSRQHDWSKLTVIASFRSTTCWPRLRRRGPLFSRSSYSTTKRRWCLRKTTHRIRHRPWLGTAPSIGDCRGSRIRVSSSRLHALDIHYDSVDRRKQSVFSSAYFPGHIRLM